MPPRTHVRSPVKNYVPAAGNFVAHSHYFTMDSTGSHLADTVIWHLLPTTPAMLSTSTRHFDTAMYMLR